MFILKAIIRLDKPLGLFYDDDVESAVIPICLPWNDNDVGRNLSNGAVMTVTGWGRVTNSKHDTKLSYEKHNVPTPLLQKLDVPLVSKVECLKVREYRLFLQLDFDLQFCAGGEEGRRLVLQHVKIVWNLDHLDELYHIIIFVRAILEAIGQFT